MPFSFSPGQEQQSSAPVAQTTNNGVPALVVPVIPTIATNVVQEKISPFAFRNRNKSMFGVYFQLPLLAIFSILIITTIGLFIYQRILLFQIDTKKQQLETKQANFKKLDINEIKKLSNRVKVINKVINERASVNTALKLLEATALDNSVTYNKFSLSKNKNGKGYDLGFGGDTNSYTAVYQQIQALNDKSFAKYFTKIIISGTGPMDKKGIVSFRADTNIAIEGVDPDTFTIDNQISSTTEAVASLPVVDNSQASTTITTATIPQ